MHTIKREKFEDTSFPRDDKCYDCFWRGETDEEGIECLRYPPHPKYGFPRMADNAWCGEFLSRKQQTG